MSDLVRYDAMIRAIAECHTVDEVKGILGQRNCRSRKYGQALKEDLAINTGGLCGYCGYQMSEITIDHIDPFGADSVGNYMVSCKTCNSRKGTKSLDEFREYMALFSLRETLVGKDPDGPSIKTIQWVVKQAWCPFGLPNYSFFFERS